MKKGVRPSPALVISIIALFVSIGGVGYASSKIGTSEIQNSAVTAKKLHKKAVVRKKIKGGAVTGAKVQDDSLTGRDVDESTLSGVLRGTDSVGGAALGGTYASPTIKPGAVHGSQLAFGSVSTDKLGTIPTARVRRTTAQPIAQGSFVPINFTTETWDTAQMHSGSAPTDLVAPIEGVYLITAHVFFADSSVGRRDLGIFLGSKAIAFTSDAAVDTDEDVLNISTVYRLDPQDSIQAKVEQTSGGALDVSPSTSGAETSPEFSMTWLGPA